MRIVLIMVACLFGSLGNALAQTNCIGVTCSVKETLDCDDEPNSNCEDFVRCFIAGQGSSFCTSVGGYSVNHVGQNYYGFRNAFYDEEGFSRVCFQIDTEVICSEKAPCTACRLGQNAGGFIDLFCGYPGGGPNWVKYKWSIDFTMSIGCVGDGA
jgi:hypothetical protein